MPTAQSLGNTVRLNGQSTSVPTAGLRSRQYGKGASTGTTLPSGGGNNGISNTLNRSLQHHRQQFSQGGNRTSTSGSRGTTQAAKNINRFGSNNANATSPGSNITGSARTNAAIDAWNQAKNTTRNPPKGTNPINKPTINPTATAAAKGTTLGAGAASSVSASSGGLFAPVASNPAGLTLGLGAAALGGGLYLGNKIYEGMGSPFGPSLGNYLNDWLGKNNQAIEPKSNSGGSSPGADVTPDPDTYGQAGRVYEVSYRTGTDYSNHYDPQKAALGLRWNDPRTLTATGPIGSGTYSNPDSIGGKHRAKYISSPDGLEHFSSTYRDVSAVHINGSNNYEVFDPQLEILDVTEVTTGNPVGPNPIELPNWPDVESLPSTAPEPSTGTNGTPLPGYAPEHDYTVDPLAAAANAGTGMAAAEPEIDLGQHGSTVSTPNPVPQVPGKRNSPSTAPSPEVLPSVNPTNPSEPRPTNPGTSTGTTTAQRISDYLQQQRQQIAENTVTIPAANPSSASVATANKTSFPAPPNALITNPPPTNKIPDHGCKGGNSQKNEECCEANAANLEQLLDELAELKEKFNASGFGSINMPDCDSDTPYFLAWNGSGLYGIYSALERLSEATEKVWDKVKCPPELNSAVPMAWESKVKEHPQLIILWAPEASGSRWSMHIPHPKTIISEDYNFNFPTYQKGAVRGTLILSDNSRLVVNGASEAECKKVISYCKNLIESQYLSDSREVFTKGIASNNVVTVKATYVKRFAGHRNQAPLWVKRIEQ